MRLSSRSDVSRLLDQLRSGTVRVRGRPIKDIHLKDEGDRRLVEAAVAGDAAYLVTSDGEMLRQRGYAGTEFITARELLRVLRSSGDLPHNRT
jgi:predicted nucleic acid-binding protein